MDEVGVVNDAAYGIPPGTIGDALAGIPSRAVHAYGIREGREAVSVAVIQDVDDDAFVTFVATLPDHRGERLASCVLAHALHEAEERGKTPPPCRPPSSASRSTRASASSRSARSTSTRSGPRDPQPGARGSQVLPALRRARRRRLPALDQLPALRLRRLLQPEAGGGGDPGHADDKIVLLRRGFDPGKGLWTFPGGFVDLGETVEEAARREAREEIEADDRTPSVSSASTRATRSGSC